MSSIDNLCKRDLKAILSRLEQEHPEIFQELLEYHKIESSVTRTKITLHGEYELYVDLSGYYEDELRSYLAGDNVVSFYYNSGCDFCRFYGEAAFTKSAVEYDVKVSKYLVDKTEDHNEELELHIQRFFNERN